MISIINSYLTILSALFVNGERLEIFMIKVNVKYFLGQVPGTAPQPKGPSIRKHHNIHIDIDQERE